MNDLLKDLNDRQRDAVLATTGPVLIIAGPGSGKTRVITHRIAYLVATGIAPEHILAVTFTNKAAEEMRLRLASLLPSRTSSFHAPSHPLINTFHAFSVKILRAHASKLGYLPNFTIFDEDDSLSLIKEVLKEFSLDPKRFSPGMLSATISNLKNELVSPEQYAENVGLTDQFPHTIHRVYVRYQERLREAHAMDFDDLLVNAVRLFETHPRILEEYQDRFRYLHVDEWQDTNRAQYVLTRSLAGKHHNIAVVGDDAQAIYGWRGADFRNVFNFERDFPGAKTIVLDKNYRSTQTILDAARHLISRNAAQKEKKLWTDKGAGAPIAVAVLPHERAEAEWLYKTMRDLLRRGRTPNDMVVLYRTNAQSRIIEEIFLAHQFSYKIIGGVKFYQRKEVKDIIAYLRILINPDDLVSLKRAINTPPRGIGRRTFLAYLASRRQAIPESSAAVFPVDRGTPALREFQLLIADLEKRMSESSPSMFIKTLLEKIGYREYLDDHSPNAEERWQNVQEFVNLAARYNDLARSEAMGKLLEDVALMSEQDEIGNNKVAVQLMTIHAAKGLEFPIVFIAGLEEGIFPHSRALFNPQELEEERRLCYVGLTRAQEQVFLSVALTRMHFGALQANAPSRFLNEIPDHLLEIDEEENIIEL